MECCWAAVWGWSLFVAWELGLDLSPDLALVLVGVGWGEGALELWRRLVPGKNPGFASR